MSNTTSQPRQIEPGDAPLALWLTRGPAPLARRWVKARSQKERLYLGVAAGFLVRRERRSALRFAA